jgi:hypothetical protein
MLKKIKTLKGYKLHGLDGEIGKAEEFYFDDRHWTVRYLVADTGHWLPGREVLISPHALGQVNEEEKSIEVHLTRKQIENCPSLGNDKPVSRQYEEVFYQYYGWPTYWGGPHKWGAYPYIVRDHEKLNQTDQDKKPWDPHLRSTQDVAGHHIQANDGEIGHVEDFILDDESWEIRYLVVDTKNWWPGKRVLVSPMWIESVRWPESKVFVNLSRGQIQQSPEYTGISMLTRDYEAGLHRHYDRHGYWLDELEPRVH